MKRIRYILLLLSILPLTLPMGAQVATIHGIVTDIPEQSRIPRVHIMVEQTNDGTVSDGEGAFSIELERVPVTLYFSHVGYHTKEVRIYRPGTQEMVVRLEEKTTYLQEFPFYDRPIVNLIKDEPLYIWDYELTDAGILLIGNVNRNSWDRRIFLLEESGDTLRSKAVKYPRQLFSDCLGNNHMYSNKDVWEVTIDEDGILLTFPTPIDTFEKVMLPVIGKIENYWFVRRYYLSNQVLVYYRVDEHTLEVTEFLRIEDELGLNILADRPRLESSQGYTEADRRFEEMCFYDEIFAPLVIMGDSLMLFNFVDGQLGIYDAEGNEISTRAMDFERGRHWEEDLLVDTQTRRVYTIWEKHGMSQLWEIDLANASITRKINIPRLPFVEKIRVRGDNVYFLYKSVNQDYKQLYRMEI